MSDEIKHDVARDADDPKNRISGMYISAHRLPYVSPTPGELPLIAIGVNSKVNSTDPKAHSVQAYTAAYLKKIQDCGFNAVQTQIGSRPFVEKGVKACSDAGIKQVVRRDDLTHLSTECPEVVDEKSEEKNHILTTTHDPKNSKIPKNDKGDAAADRVRQWVETTLNHKEEVGKDPTSPNEGGQEDEPEYLSNMEGCGCYQLGDEPIMRMYPWFAKIKDRILESDNWERMSFLNLLPRHAEANDGGAGTASMAGCKRRRYINSEDRLDALPVYDAYQRGRAYQIYLDEFESIYHPSVWCYDGYFIDDSYPNVVTPRFQDQYFADLEAVRRQALKTGRPFWSTVRALYRKAERWTGPEHEIPENYAEYLGRAMSIEAYCALAYGAKGLMFWAMMARPNKEDPDNNFQWAPLCYDLANASTGSEDGQIDAVETRLYPKVKEVVAEVKRYERLFLSSRVIRLGHFNHEYFGENQNAINFGFLSNIKTKGSFCLAHHVTPVGEFIVVANTNTSEDPDTGEGYDLVLEGGDLMYELTDRGRFDPQNGTMRKVPAVEIGGGTGGGLGSTDIIKGDIYELQPDPYGKLKFGTTIDPGDWRIFYRARKIY